MVLFDGSTSLLEMALQVADQLRTMSPQFIKAASCIRSFNLPLALKEIDLSFDRTLWPKLGSEELAERYVALESAKASASPLAPAQLEALAHPRGEPVGPEAMARCKTELKGLFPYTFNHVKNCGDPQELNNMACCFRSAMYRHMVDEEPPDDPLVVEMVFSVPPKVENVFDMVLIQAKTIMALQERGANWKRVVEAAKEAAEEPVPGPIHVGAETGPPPTKVYPGRSHSFVDSLPLRSGSSAAAAAADMTEPL